MFNNTSVSFFVFLINSEHCILIKFFSSLSLSLLLGTHKPSIKPNAFVSIRISSPEIKANMERVQQEMQHRDRRLRSTMVSLDKLHLTLMVLRLDNSEEEKRYVYIIIHSTHTQVSRVK